MFITAFTRITRAGGPTTLITIPITRRCCGDDDGAVVDGVDDVDEVVEGVVEVVGLGMVDVGKGEVVVVIVVVVVVIVVVVGVV